MASATGAAAAAPGVGSTSGSGPEFVVGADGQPALYPAPLFMRNTFLEVPLDRPSSLEEFLQERQAYSCPGSSVSQPGSSCEGTRTMPITKRVPYRPGELLAKSAAFGSNAPLTMCQPRAGRGAHGEEMQAAGAAPGGPDQDAGSECSTVDTMQRQRSSLSPALEVATPALVESKKAAPEAARPAESRSPEPPAAAAAAAGAAEKEEALVSAGSVGHHLGQCKPCAFIHTKGCSSGVDCKFCHLCEPGEKQRRQKEKRAFFGTMRQLQKMAVETWGSLGAAQQ